MIGLITIATGGPNYTKYLGPLLVSAKQFFPPHKAFVLTDEQSLLVDAVLLPQANLGWPRATLMRYHAMLRYEKQLSQMDYLFYCDVDMLFCSRIESTEILSEGLAPTLHPGFVETFERNPNSTAYVSEGTKANYYQGCFVGGKTSAFLQMCKVISKNIDTDDGNGIVAIYHDESHLNRYMIDNPPAKILTPAYCFPGPAHIRFPERWYKGDIRKFIPKARHLEKLDQNTWKH